MKAIIAGLAGFSMMLICQTTAIGQDAIWRSMFTPGGGTIIAVCANHDSLVFCNDLVFGLYTSTCRGMTWSPTPVEVPNQCGHGAIAVSPSGCIFVNIYYGKLYRSIDRGAHWELCRSNVSGYPVSFMFAGNQDTYVGCTEGVLKSTDDGSTWSSSLALSDPEDYVAQVLFAPDSAMFAVTLKTIFRSTDSGHSWDRTGAPPGAMAIAPNNTITIASSSSFLESLDGCRTWRKVGNIQNPPYVPQLFYSSRGSLFYWSLTDTGVVRSEDYGRTWSLVMGLPFRGISMISESDSGWLYAASENGVFRSTDQGNRWTSMNNGLVPVMVSSLATDAEARVFAGTVGRGIYMSTDCGEEWEIRTNGYDVQYPSTIYASGRCGTIFAGDAAGIHRSFDNGSTWHRIPSSSQIYSFFQSSAGILYAGGCDTLLQSSDCGENWSVASSFTGNWAIWAIIENRHGDLFLATSAGLLGSQDGALQWTELASPAPGSFGIRTLARDSKGTLFAGTDGVLRSTDDGASWQQTLKGPDFVRVVVDGNDHVYAGTLTGVFRSTDGGSSWTEFNTGLINKGGAITAIAYDSVTGHIYVAQDSGGVARTIVPAYAKIPNGIHLDHSLPRAFILVQNYPNPFNPSTTIRYGVPHRSHVTLMVFNPLGQTIAELVNGDIDAGFHEVQFNATNLASGVYFYRLQTGDFSQTRKLCVIR
jgi:photosystem II stability/assembly factor-like uncharacterized protein